MERQVSQHEVWVALHQQTVVNQTPFLDYTIRNGWLYKLNLLCVPQSEDHLLFIKEAHASSCGGHFGITKTVQNLQHQFYWPSLQRRVEKFIRACIYALNPNLPTESTTCISHSGCLPDHGNQFQWIFSVECPPLRENMMPFGY